MLSEIPEDVMMNAERLYDEGGYKNVPQIIAEAIMAERARCEAALSTDAEPVAYLRPCTITMMRSQFESLTLSDKDDPRSFPVYAAPPAPSVAVKDIAPADIYKLLKPWADTDAIDRDYITAISRKVAAALSAQVQDVAGTVEMVENCVLFSTPGEYAGLADHAAFEAGQDNAIRTVVKLLRDNLPAAPAKQEG